MNARIQRQQDWQQIADRRGAADIAAKAGAIAHLACREPRQHVVQCAELPAQLVLDPGQRHAGADVHRVIADRDRLQLRSEEHTSELQSLMRISYAVFCLKKKNTTNYKCNRHTIRTE